MTLHLLRNAQVYAPNYLGQKDILVCHGKIAALAEHIKFQSNLEIAEFDCAGNIVCPGFVDSLTHFTGGGGEGGFSTRTPEMNLSDAIKGGVTTVTGALGTDATCRSHAELIAKAKALKEEGLSAYIYTGNYHYPIQTLTGSVQKDIMFLDECIGVGEVAISDHRGSQIGWQELAHVAADARVGGMCSGKAGIVLIHVGSGQSYLTPLFDVAAHTDIPLAQFYPTHVNRSQALLNDGIQFALQGGTIDFTASTTPEILDRGEVSCAEGLAQAISAGVSDDFITFSTDGHASLPQFNDDGELDSLKVGAMTSLLDALKASVLESDIPLEIALKTVTQNPARVLKLPSKGRLEVGLDADLLILSKDLSLQSVMAGGQWFMHNTQLVRKGTFEE